MLLTGERGRLQRAGGGGDQKPTLLKMALFPHFKTIAGHKWRVEKVFLTWPAAAVVLPLASPRRSLSRRYAAIRAFCLINNLSVMY